MSLPYYEELAYIHQLSLRNAKKVSNGWRISCPWCNEGTSPWKTRCSIIMPTQLHDHITVSCFNCGLATNVKKLIEKVQPSLLDEYEAKEKQLFIEGLANGRVSHKLQDKPPTININTRGNQKPEFEQLLQYQFTLNEKYFKPAIEFEDAVKFCKERRIYEQIHRFKYCTNTESAAGGMVIFPFYTGYGDSVYGFQGRSPKDKRFHTFSPNECFKVFGVFEVNKKKPVIVCESIIDSFSVDNGIAMLGTSIGDKVQTFLKDCNLLYILDNDKTGIEKSVKYADMNYKLFIWPEELRKYKDLNDMRQDGFSREEIQQIIDDNVYSGSEAVVRLKFRLLKKC
jgi:hypothetical protein